MGGTERTVDIGAAVAATADNLAVVADAEFVQTWSASRLDATHQPIVRACEYSMEPTRAAPRGWNHPAAQHPEPGGRQ